MLLVPGTSKLSDVTGRQNPNTPARYKEMYESPVRIPCVVDKLRTRATFKDKRYCNAQQCSKADLLLVLTHWGQVTQICVFTLLLCKTDDANLRF